jgi:alkylation response protein AidB-like acyl-CoA dehydrogenase
MRFDLEYSPGQEEFRREVSAWFDRNVPPGIGAVPLSAEHSRVLYVQRRELGRKLGQRGWLYPSGEPPYGGGGLDFDQIIVLEEEAFRHGVKLPPYYDSGGRHGSAVIRLWGTEEQKARFLPPIYTGQVASWQLLSEPSAGSDLAGVRSTAIRDGDSYIVNGQKIFVGSSHGADRFWILLVTDPHGKRHENLSWFMIDARLPGIEIHPQYLLIASGEGETDEFGHKNTVYFKDVRIPADALIGGENNGWKVAGTHLEGEHGGRGSIRPNPLWDQLLNYCQHTYRDGQRLIDDPEVQIGLAEIYSRLEIVRLLSIRNFWMLHSRQKRSYEGSQAIYIRKMTHLWLTNAILTLLGSEALTNDSIRGAMDGVAETQQRAGIVQMHPAGTTDIHRVIMARRLGIGKRERERPGRLAEDTGNNQAAGTEPTTGTGT